MTKPSLGDRVDHLEAGLESAHSELARLGAMCDALLETVEAQGDLIAMTGKPPSMSDARFDALVADAEKAVAAARYRLPAEDLPEGHFVDNLGVVRAPDGRSASVVAGEKADVDAVFAQQAREHHEFLKTVGAIAPDEKEAEK